MSYGNIIKKLRLSRNMTLLELSQQLGVSEGTASRYESSEIVNLKYETIVKMSEIFNVSPAVLMGWEKRKEEDDIDVLTVELHNNPELRVLLDAGAKLTKEDLDFVIKMAERMNNDE